MVVTSGRYLLLATLGAGKTWCHRAPGQTARAGLCRKEIGDVQVEAERSECRYASSLPLQQGAIQSDYTLLLYCVCLLIHLRYAL